MTTDILFLLVVLAALVLLDLAAARWGVDTRPGFDPGLVVRRNF